MKIFKAFKLVRQHANIIIFYLLATSIACYLIFPYMLFKNIPASLNGIVLITALLAHLLFQSKKIPYEIQHPFSIFTLSLIISTAASVSIMSLITLKTIIIGIVASVLIAFYTQEGNRLKQFSILFASIIIFQGLWLFIIEILPENYFPFLTLMLLSQKIMRWGDNVIIFGTSLIFAVIVLLFWMEKTKMKKYAYPLIFLLSISITLTANRAIWGAYLFSITIFLLLRKRVARLAIVATIFLIAWTFTPSIIHSKAAEINSKNQTKKLIEDIGIQHGRGAFILIGLRMWCANPVFGVGLGRFEDNSSRYESAELKDSKAQDETIFAPHNIFVSLLAETGLIGLSGFFILLFLIMKQVYERYRIATERSRTKIAACLAFQAGLIIVACFHDILDDRIWWIGLGLLSGSSLANDSA